MAALLTASEVAGSLPERVFAVHHWDFNVHGHVDEVCASLTAAQTRRVDVRQHIDASALVVCRTGSGPYELYLGGAA